MFNFDPWGSCSRVYLWICLVANCRFSFLVPQNFREKPAGTEQTRGTTDWLMSGSTDWLVSPPVMKRWLMFSTSLRNLHSAVPEVGYVNYFLWWLSDWVMDERGLLFPPPPRGGPTGKGPHLKRQLHNAGESRRYALLWPRSAVGSQWARAEIK